MIENMLERIILEQGFTPKVILTGGLSRIVSDAIQVNVEVVESLTLDGLEAIYKLNN
jgi:pantothenate kinase type III